MYRQWQWSKYCFAFLMNDPLFVATIKMKQYDFCSAGKVRHLFHVFMVYLNWPIKVIKIKIPQIHDFSSISHHAVIEHILKLEQMNYTELKLFDACITQ